ncbi:TetR/AcrR family transcriptional regulator [Methanocella sp. MCL-LM]|uniref:TetR/AcrR family transcriptional regulator n=1 Tax=Methanocella sp. MCL-LM TaxID=3412035 RepID=UPI003C74C37B
MSGWSEVKDNHKRNTILDAAECLLRAHGPESVTMDSVARKAGISRAMLHQYFSNRESLYAAVAARIVESLNATINSHTSGHTGLRKLRASGRAVECFMRNHPEKMAVLKELQMVRARDPGDENVRELLRLVRANQQVLAEAVKESGSRNNFVAGIDPLATGQFLRMALHDARSLPPAHLAMLDHCGIRCEDFLKNVRDPVYRSILISPDN